MSVPVGLDRLREAIKGFEAAPYLLTVSDDGRPHSVAVACTWDGDELVVPAGNRTVANARTRPLVCVLWPPDENGGYSLIVDGDVVSASGDGSGDNVVVVRPTRAVLHRPRTTTGQSGSGCAADCEPVLES